MAEKSLAYGFILRQWQQGKLTPEQVQTIASRGLITQTEAGEIAALPQG